MRSTLMLCLSGMFALPSILYFSFQHPAPGPPPQPVRLPPALPVSYPDLVAACQTGCSIGNHPITPLRVSEFNDLLARFQSEPMAEGSEALETLLFHALQVRGLIVRHGTGTLDAERAAFLTRELARTHVRVSVRIVDTEGVVRARWYDGHFPIGQKIHLHADATERLQPLEISGTVHRTGLNHLWTRI